MHFDKVIELVGELSKSSPYLTAKLSIAEASVNAKLTARPRIAQFGVLAAFIRGMPDDVCKTIFAAGFPDSVRRTLPQELQLFDSLDELLRLDRHQFIGDALIDLQATIAQGNPDTLRESVPSLTQLAYSVGLSVEELADACHDAPPASSPICASWLRRGLKQDTVKQLARLAAGPCPDEAKRLNWGNLKLIGHV